MAWSGAPFRRAVVSLAALVACGGVPGAWSAELAVRVVDGDGVELPGVALSVLRAGPVPGAAAVPASPARPPSATTDLAGRAVIAGLVPGVYRVVFPGAGLEERWLLTPPSGDEVLTLPDERARAELTLVLRRGDRLVATVEAGESSHACASIRLVEQAGRGEFAFAACTSRESRRIVPPGRWTVTATGQNGAIFESLELDGVPAPGPTAEFEVTAGGRAHDLRLRYGSGCRISGQTRWNVGKNPPAAICARLVAPGPRLAAALAAGEQQPDHVCIPIAESGGWSGRVADGSWTIAPEGERLLDSLPPSATFECRGGEGGSFDFELRARDEEETDTLHVKVVTAEGEAVRGAVVELFARDAGPPESAEPLALAQRSGPDSGTSFLRVPRRDLVAVAAHPVYGDGRLDLGLRRGHVVLALERRAALAIVATGSDGKAFRGVEVTLDAESGAPPPKPASRASKWRMAQVHRRAVTDATGRATLQGLRPGRWRAQPSVTGPDAARWTAAVLVAEHETKPETVVEVPETGQVALAIRVRPATAIELRLACDDGGQVPMRASVALLEPHADAAWRSALPVGTLEAETTRDGLPLGGPQLDRLVAGPLPAGRFAIALRPEGFDRWTFAPGTEDPARAGVYALGEGESLDFGAWTLACGPSILLVPEWSEPRAEAPPDIARAEVAVEPVAAPSGAAASAPVAGPVRPPQLQPLLHAMRLTGLTPGRYAATIAVTDRFLLPAGARPDGDGAMLTLERGRETVRRVPFAAPAGSVDVASDEAAVRLLDAAGGTAALLTQASAGVFRAGPLPLGTYRVEACRDAGCAAGGVPLGEATIVAGAVTRVP
ncbi:MAG: hypothetical protein MUF27_17640 [Acidobacteria bacterium]|jgi:hypothetical protein|nr:hypothetical protein [Acidobacteriota bacterium]